MIYVSTQIRRWGGALSACKDLMVTSLDSSRVPGARALGQTIDIAAGYLGAPESLKSVVWAVRIYTYISYIHIFTYNTLYAIHKCKYIGGIALTLRFFFGFSV